MDFRSLTRRDLQFLCKRNRIPANQTNNAMVNALLALETVEGIEEIQEVLGFQSPKQPESESPAHPPTSQRVSARRSIQGDKTKNQEQLASSQPRSRRVTVKVMEVIEMDSKEEEGEKKEATKHFPKTPATTRRTSRGQEASSCSGKANQEDGISIVTPTSVHTGRTRPVKRVAVETPKVVEAKEGKNIGVTRRSTRLSSRKTVEETITAKAESRSNRSKAKEAVKMSALAKEDAEEQETEEEKKASLENGDSSVLLVEDVGKNDQEVKTLHSSLDVENSKIEVFESPLEEVGENNQEIESHDISSFLNPEEEAAGKQLVDASPLEKSSIMTPLPGETGSREENSTEVKESAAEEEVGEKNREIESRGLSSILNPEEAAGKELVHASLLKKSSIMTPLPSNIGSPEDNYTEVKESNILNEAFAFVKESSEETPTDEVLTDSSSSSGAKVTISSDTEVLLSCGVEKEEEEKIALLFTEMTLKEAEESGNALTEAGIVQDASIFVNSTSKTDFVEDARVTSVDGCSTETIYTEFPNEADEFTNLPPVVVALEDALLDCKNLDAGSDLCDEPLVAEGIGVSFAFASESRNKVKEISGEQIRDSIDRDLQDARELEVAVEMPHETTETLQEEVKETGSNHLTGEILEVPPQEAGELAAKEFVDVPPHKSDSSRGTTFETSTVGGSMSESADAGKETSGEFSSKISVVIDEPSIDVLQKTEILQEAVDSKVVQIQSTDSEVANLAEIEMAEEKEEMKAIETEEGADDDSNELDVSERDICSTETTPLSEFSKFVQIQSSEVANIAAVEMAEEKEEMKAVETNEGADDSNELNGRGRDICSTETIPLSEFSKVVQIQSTESEVANQTSVEMVEEKEEMKVAETEGADERDICSTETMPLSLFSDVQIQSTESEVANQTAVEMAEEKEEMKAVETEEGADDDSNELNCSERDICSPETMPLSELSKFVQIQSTDSEVAYLAAVEMAEEKEEMKAVEAEEGADNDSYELNGSEREVCSTETMPLSELSIVVQIQSTDSQVARLAAVEMAEEKKEKKAVEAEEGADNDSYELNGSEREVCSTETMPNSELSIVVQIQSTDSQVACLAAVEMTEEKEETKAVETQKSFEDQNITAELSLPKLGDGKNEAWMVEEKWDKNKSVRKVKDEKLVDLSLTKLRAMYKQKLDDRKNEMEGSKYGNSKQNLNDDLLCLSHSKLYACSQKLNDDRNKLGKRTPLKNLN